MALTITDDTGKQVQVTITTNENAETKVVFSPGFTSKDGSWISYIETDFNMHYAPDVVGSVKRVWAHFPKDSQLILTDMLLQAALCVGGWDIRDAKDAKDKKMVLDTCKELGLDVEIIEVRP